MTTEIHQLNLLCNILLGIFIRSYSLIYLFVFLYSNRMGGLSCSVSSPEALSSSATSDNNADSAAAASDIAVSAADRYT